MDYTNFLEETAAGAPRGRVGLARIMAAMAPCMRLYAVLGSALRGRLEAAAAAEAASREAGAPFAQPAAADALAAGGGTIVDTPAPVWSSSLPAPYATWVSLYSSDDFEADAASLEGLLDAAASDCDVITADVSIGDVTAGAGARRSAASATEASGLTAGPANREDSDSDGSVRGGSGGGGGGIEYLCLLGLYTRAMALEAAFFEANNDDGDSGGGNGGGGGGGGENVAGAAPPSVQVGFGAAARGPRVSAGTASVSHVTDWSVAWPSSPAAPSAVVQSPPSSLPPPPPPPVRALPRAANFPLVLTVAGSDSGGGAGIQADLKAALACGAFGMSAVTALTAQNTAGVAGVLTTPPAFVAAQMDAVLGDMGPCVVKTGMLPDAATVEVVALKLRQYLATGAISAIVVRPIGVINSFFHH